MHTVFALLCFVVVIHWLIFPYPSGLLHWHCDNLTIAPVPAKQPWWIWINTSCEFIMNDCITTTKQITTKPCAYFLGYTVGPWMVGYKNVQLNKVLTACDHRCPFVSVRLKSHTIILLNSIDMTPSIFNKGHWNKNVCVTCNRGIQFNNNKKTSYEKEAIELSSLDKSTWLHYCTAK